MKGAHLTRDELIKALRLFHYDPKWKRWRRGRRTSGRLVPMRALADQSGVNYVQIYRAVLSGQIGENAYKKLTPFVDQILKGKGKFVFVYRKGYEFRSAPLRRMRGWTDALE